MSLNNIISNLILDVYDHDATPTTIKSIACDDNVRYVAAELNYSGIPYYIPSDALVELTILRPDGVGVSITGEPYPFTITEESDNEGEESVTTIVYGAYGELDTPAVAIAGILFGQFKITNNSQILRTEIFRINNGRALDAEISEWTDVYQGYNLDEIVERLKSVEAVINRISVHDGGIYINS